MFFKGVKDHVGPINLLELGYSQVSVVKEFEPAIVKGLEESI